MNKVWTLDVKQNDSGEHFIEFPEEALVGTGWKEGDTIRWIDNKDGSWTLMKRETQYVLVETVQMFRHRYVVEVPTGKAEWALDTVSMEEAKEFSQKHLGETISCHRVLDGLDELIKICDEDNDYVKSWPVEKKIEAFVTSLVKENE